MTPEDRLSAIEDRFHHLFFGIRALVVLDGRSGSSHYASFGHGDLTSGLDAYFGLGEFIRTLTTSAAQFTRIAVTRAHRDTDVNHAADLELFRFDDHDLSQYDVIFLFGVAGPGGTDAPMTESELAALGSFMDAGGGVFATGDHEDLGVELNGRVPRVRSMRAWYFPNPGPLGEPVAPPAIGVERIETTQPRPGEMFLHFDDQSDDIPQPLELRWYSYQRSLLVEGRYPHPLLCGPRGAITVIPDHMHEGQVIEPWDTGATLSYAGTSFVEYPTSALGVQPLPEIVAWGQVLAESDVSTEPAAHTGDPQHVARGHRFGVVCAYDGHQAGVGRVAVDSTWHHFFDINLIGDPVAPYPKTEGFNASPAGQQALEDIRSYFRNLAMWLARPGAQRRVFASAAWYSLRTQPLAMIVTSRRAYSHMDAISIGALALKNIYRFTPPCSVLVSLLPYLVDGPVAVTPPDPWAAPHPGDPPSIDPALFLQAALGGAIIALAKEQDKLLHTDEETASSEVLRLVESGVSHGLRGLGVMLDEYAKRVGRVADGLRG